MSDEIYLREYDVNWRSKALEEANALRKVLPEHLSVHIEHIGSTAIPGIRAKPILDLMIGVSNLEGARIAISTFESMGYSYWRDNPKRDRLYFVKGLPEFGGSGRTHHIHMVELDSEFWKDHLLFRDFLRSNSSVAMQYENLKIALASEFRADREAYTEGKAEFIKKVLDQARSSVMRA